MSLSKIVRVVSLVGVILKSTQKDESVAEIFDDALDSVEVKLLERAKEKKGAGKSGLIPRIAYKGIKALRAQFSFDDDGTDPADKLEADLLKQIG